MRVLFVCLGNICRSPMAAGFALRLARERGLDLDPGSAGLAAQVEIGLTGEAREVMREAGIDISGHRPRQLSRELVRWADVIVPMETAQARVIEARFPEAGEKILELDEDVVDPYGGSRSDYRRSRDAVGSGLEAIWPALEARALAIRDDSP